MMAPGREAEIQAGGRRLLPVSKHFLVVAIGLPVPTYHGAPLDPPLRSRFAAKRVIGDEGVKEVKGETKLQQLVKLWRLGNRMTKADLMEFQWMSGNC